MAPSDEEKSPKPRSAARRRRAKKVEPLASDSPDGRRRDESFYTPRAQEEDSESSEVESEDGSAAESGVQKAEKNRQLPYEPECAVPPRSPRFTRATEQGPARKDPTKPPDIGWKDDLLVGTPVNQVKLDSRSSRPAERGNGSPSLVAILAGFAVLLVGVLALTKGFVLSAPRPTSPKVKPDPAVIAREGIAALRAKFLQQNVATWGTLSDVLEMDFRKGRGPAVLLLVAQDPANGAASANCLADGISRLMSKIVTLDENDNLGVSMDFEPGDEQSFHNAAAKLKEFESSPDITSVIIRNIQSIRFDHFVLILQGASDPHSAVRKDAGVIFIADLDPNKTLSSSDPLKSGKHGKGLSEYQAAFPDDWDPTRKKTEAWKRWAKDEARAGLKNSWAALRAENNGAGVPVEKVGPVLSRIAGTRVIYVLPEERLPSECR